METVYGSPSEELPPDDPIATGNLVHTLTYCDAVHVDDIIVTMTFKVLTFVLL